MLFYGYKCPTGKKTQTSISNKIIIFVEKYQIELGKGIIFNMVLISQNEQEKK